VGDAMKETRAETEKASEAWQKMMAEIDEREGKEREDLMGTMLPGERRRPHTGAPGGRLLTPAQAKHEAEAELATVRDLLRSAYRSTGYNIMGEGAEVLTEAQRRRVAGLWERFERAENALAEAGEVDKALRPPDAGADAGQPPAAALLERLAVTGTFSTHAQGQIAGAETWQRKMLTQTEQVARNTGDWRDAVIVVEEL